MTLQERAKNIFPPVAGRSTNLGVLKAEGAYVYAEDGRRYLDFASGVAVANTGHNHPTVVKAAEEQLKKAIHVGHNVAWYELYVNLGERLVKVTGGDTMVYFSNSGAEANEGSIKLAKYVNKRPAIIAFKGAFHGRTLGTISITTSSSAYRKNYEGLLPSVYFADYPYCYRCPFGREQAKCDFGCTKQFDFIFKHQVAPDQVAAIIMEPVAGEGGYIVPPIEFVQTVRNICDEHGIYLILDEIQTGFGRTGKLFAYEHFGIRPDIMSTAKGIASGFPLSAVVGKKEIMEQWPAGAHGGTFGGNPIACAAGLATLDLLEGGLVENAQAMGEYFKAKVVKLQSKHNCIGDVRGLGLMIGAEIVKESREPAGDLVRRILKQCLDEGLLLLNCGPDKNVIRFIAPLIVTKDQIDQALQIVSTAIEAAEG